MKRSQLFEYVTISRVRWHMRTLIAAIHVTIGRRA